MQAAGRVHLGDLRSVMKNKKEEAEAAVRRDAATIVNAFEKLRRAGGGRDRVRLSDGISVENPLSDGISVFMNLYRSTRPYSGFIEIEDPKTPRILTRMNIGRIVERGEEYKLKSPDVAEITTRFSSEGRARMEETPPRFRTLLLEVARQLTGKKVVTTWINDVRYKYGIGSEWSTNSMDWERLGENRDVPRELRLVKDKMKANPGAVVVLLTGHLKK
jgi:hypothetical protein